MFKSNNKGRHCEGLLKAGPRQSILMDRHGSSDAMPQKTLAMTVRSGALFCMMLALLFTVTSCVPMLVGTGTAVGGKIVSQDKTIGESISDATIWTKIRASFLRNGIDGLWGSINITVSEGRVLVTGYVKNKEDIITILKIIWAQNSVKDVINEIKVEHKNANKDELTKYAKDTWITTKIKTKMFVEANVRSVNYNVETIDCVVYLFGVARTQEEMDRVEDIAHSIKDVKDVRSYIRARENVKSVHNHNEAQHDILEDNMSEYSKPVVLDHNHNRASPAVSKEYEVGDIQ